MALALVAITQTIHRPGGGAQIARLRVDVAIHPGATHRVAEQRMSCLRMLKPLGIRKREIHGGNTSWKALR